MKHRVNLFVAVCILISMNTSCSVCKVAKHSPIAEIQFGSGGGVTGAVNTSHLYADGKLYKGDNYVKTLSCDSLSAVFNMAETITDNQIHPDNVYNFVRIIRKDGTTYYHCWSWGDIRNIQSLQLYQKLIQQ